MASFCEKCDADKVICQKCGRDVCSKEEEVEWKDGIGNVCKTCRVKTYHHQHWYPRPGNCGYDLMC